MLISDDFLYFELHKTGCTHTRKILKLAVPNSIVHGVHNTYDSIDPDILGDFDKKLKIGNVRNPWDWYVSLWAFGCMKRGAIYQQLKKVPRLYRIPILRSIMQNGFPYSETIFNFKKFEKLYSNPNNVDNFREWPKAVFTDEKISLGEGFKEAKVSSFIGLLIDI